MIIVKVLIILISFIPKCINDPECDHKFEKNEFMGNLGETCIEYICSSCGNRKEDC